MITHSWLTLLTLSPVVFGILVAGLPSKKSELAKFLAFASSAISALLVCFLATRFDPVTAGIQFVEARPWIGSLGIEYKLGIDGLSLLLLLLAALLTPMAMLASGVREEKPLYFGLMLLLQAGLFGTFTAQNFFHWFLFWELSLVPAFFLVRLWGGPLRVEAANQFFLYTMTGSAALLLAFLALYLCTGTFDFQKLAEMGRTGTLTQAISDNLGWRDLTTRNVTLVIFAAAFFGFAVKVPLFPFHTWLPLTYAEAPTGVTMLLTGLMSKMGLYGFIRILLPIFPIQMHWMATPLMGLAVLSIVLSAAAAWSQSDLKRALAYSSINHLGYCLLAVFALATAPAPQIASIEKVTALNGVFLQIFNHGLTASLLFWMAGILAARNNGRRGLNDFGGIRNPAPILCGLMGIALFSSMGLPGLNGFVGEFLIFKGTLGLAKWAAILSAAGLLFTAIFILNILQKVFMGPVALAGFRDLAGREIALLTIPASLLFLLGVYPQALIRFFNATAVSIAQQIGF